MVTNNELDQIEQRIDCVAQALEGCKADAQAAFAFLCTELARRATSGSDGTAAAGADALDAALRAAGHALRSYQYGNSSPDLAAQTADSIDALLSDRAAATSGSELADELPPLTMAVYGTRTALELERQRRADLAARAALAQQAGVPADDARYAKLVSQVHYWMDRGDRAQTALDAAEYEIAELRAAAPAPAAEEVRDAWRDLADLPPDYRQVLVELKPLRKNSKPVYAVGRYFRTQKGVHEGDPGWADNEGDDIIIVRWKYIDAAMSASQGKTEEAKCS